MPPDWALRRVPGLQRGQAPRRFARLPGGSVNQVFRIDSADGRFVLRLNGPAWRRPGVDRQRELLLHREAAAAEVAPAIVAAEPDAHGLLITEFHDGRLWGEADYRDLDSLKRLGERLQVLHALPVPEIAPFDPWRIAEQYLRQIAGGPGARLLPRHLDETLARLERSCAQIARADARSVIVHGDLAHGNLLQGRRLWLLDWEYAQRSDALMDLACVLAYYPGAEPYLGELAAAAGIGAFDRAQLAERIHVYRALSWLWHLARGEPASAP